MGSKCILTLLALLAPYSAVATVCIPLHPHPPTLQESYRAASSIVVARASGCLDRPVSEHGVCPDHRYQFEVVEVLKDSPAASGYPMILRGSDEWGCGPFYAVGQEHLIFFNDEGGIARGSGYLDGPDQSLFRRYLAILREYRDGLTVDLSEPWRFTDSGIHCQVSHNFDGGGLLFSFRYVLHDRPIGFTIRKAADGKPVRGPDGELVFDPDPDMPANEMARTELVTSPKLDRTKVIFGAIFHEPERIQSGSMTANVGDQSWPLEREVTVTYFPYGEPDTRTVELAGGAIAEEILNAVTEPTEIVFSATDTGAASPEEAGRPIQYRTKSTRFAPAARRFMACVAGTVRRGEN